MASPIEFYWFPLSQPSRAVKEFLLYTQIPHEDKNVNLMAEEHKTEDYAKINPRQTVPAIKEGDFLLGESVAILKYLSETRESVPATLWPADPKKRADVDKLLEWYQCHFRPASTAPLIAGLMDKMRGCFDPEVLKFACQQAAVQYQMLEKLLSLNAGPYLLGEELTLADFLIYNEACDMEVDGRPYTDYPKVEAYIKKMRELKEVQQVEALLPPLVGPIMEKIKAL